jgi:hypothetical protein
MTPVRRRRHRGSPPLRNDRVAGPVYAVTSFSPGLTRSDRRPGIRGGHRRTDVQQCSPRATSSEGIRHAVKR